MGPQDQICAATPDLTAKQHEAVNLLIQHKTSKEISRILGISPHTVDQRIETAKKKFGATTRGQLAQAYLAAFPMGERLTYQNSHIAEQALVGETSALDEPEPLQTMLDPNWSGRYEPSWHPKSYQVVHEMFFGPMGTIYRLAAIAILAVLLVVAVLGGISIFVTMTEVLSK